MPGEADWPNGEGYSVALDDAVLRITFTRPDRANAMLADDARRLSDVFREVNLLPAGTVRCIAISGQGKHFCAGADLGGAADSTEKPRVTHMLRRLAAGAHALVQSVWECNVPVVCAVQGRAAGLGANLALAGDFVVASTDASFGFPFVERGFSADSGATWLVPRLIGVARANELLLRAKVLDAETAERWGMITSVVAAAELDASVEALVREVASSATVAVGVTKQLLRRHLVSSLPMALEDQGWGVELTLRSDDFKEGMRAFAQRRAPLFTGR